ncbi:MAG: NAD regulator [Paracoccaceae bacterium]|nr:NAD regulator [Paracoccaceae bacterium]
MTSGQPAQPVRVELSAVIVTLEIDAGRARPMVLTPRGAEGRDLPTAAFDPDRHRTLHEALADGVEATSGIRLGYVEQLYTFGDPRRSAARDRDEPHTVSIGYLALVPPDGASARPGWTPWSHWFPWEDRRQGIPQILTETILPRLQDWAGSSIQRREQIALVFGAHDGAQDIGWRDELTLERYEMLYSARLVPESWRDRGAAAPPDIPALGAPARRDHRRILATAIGRLRGKLKYRPVLFELMGEVFTLTELQRAAEAVSGVALHKQNFRRMVERSGLIEPTGGVSTRLGGRPAAEYRFGAEAIWERRAAAVRFGGARRGG